MADVTVKKIDDFESYQGTAGNARQFFSTAQQPVGQDGIVSGHFHASPCWPACVARHRSDRASCRKIE